MGVGGQDETRDMGGTKSSASSMTPGFVDAKGKPNLLLLFPPYDTKGPASHSVETLRVMLRAGMQLARINLAW